MQVIINSGNILTFSTKVTFDPFLKHVIFDTSGSTYIPAGINNVKIAFSLVDQDGVVLDSIDWTNPQLPTPASNQIYTLDLSALNLAFFFQTYQIIAAIQDNGSTVYQTTPVYKKICQPVNMTDAGYVPGLFQLTPDCVNSVLTVKELTLQVYDNLKPFSSTTSGTLFYPTGTISSVAFTGTPFTNNVVYTGQYRVTNTTASTYSLQDDVYVVVTYYTNNVFDVTCADFLGDIICCLQETYQTYKRNCNNAIGQNALNLYNSVTPLVLNGLIKQTIGQDASWEVKEIRKILACDCGSRTLSQTQFTPINPAVNSIVISGDGGTTVPAPTVNGNTQNYVITSSIYQVVKGNGADAAFTITPDMTVSNTVKYAITFNYDTMAGYILTAIGNDPTLISQLNNLINSTAGNLAGLNGKCINNYTSATYSVAQAVTGLTLITQIVINGTVYLAPANTFGNNAGNIQTWLNSLTLGTFNVNVNAGILSIITTGNSNVVSTISMTSPNLTLLFQSTNVTLLQVLQDIINYLCGITSLQVALGNALALCSLDYNYNVVTTSYSGSQKQSEFNAGIQASICNLATRMSSLTGLTCAKLQAIFQDYPNAVFNYGSDRFLSIVGGNCTSLTAKQAALAIINAINSDATVKSAYCAISCAAPATCPDVSAASLNIVNSTTIGLYGVTWNTTPSANQTATVRYRVHGTTAWTVATSSLNLFPNGNINGTSPFQIAGLQPATQYDVWVQNNCGGTGLVTTITTPANNVFNTSVLLDNSVYNICGDSPVTVYSSVPFAQGVTLYTNIGLTILVTGFTFVAPVSTGVIYALNTSTGVVGASTGNVCSSGTSGSYLLGNNTGTICGGVPIILYTNGAFAVGKILYVDSALTTPQTGYSFAVWLGNNHIYNVNSVTGAVTSDTGLSCSGTTVNITSSMVGTTMTNVTGITGFTPSPAFPLNVGGTIVGTHSGFTGQITVVISGTPTFNSNLSLYRNGILVQCINVVAAGTYIFGSQTYAASDLINISANTGNC